MKVVELLRDSWYSTKILIKDNVHNDEFIFKGDVGEFFSNKTFNINSLLLKRYFVVDNVLLIEVK